MPESEPARFDRIVREHGDGLWRLTSGYESDPAERQDLYQEILFAVWRALPRFRGDASERTFVFRIGHNRGLTHRWRRGRRRTEPLDHAGPVADPGPAPDLRRAGAERARLMGEAVRALRLPLRQVLMLHLEELSHREIGEVLGITENNVAVRLNRAREALRRALEPVGAAGGER